eukprot:126790-Pleurochrysis_carterae.AAC.6
MPKPTSDAAASVCASSGVPKHAHDSAVVATTSIAEAIDCAHAGRETNAWQGGLCARACPMLIRQAYSNCV